MDGWNLALAVVAGYVAVIALVRFMLARRSALLTEFRGKMADEKRKHEDKGRDPPRG